MDEKDLEKLAIDMEEYLVPKNLRKNLYLYFSKHILPGRFLTACLENNLEEALSYASERSWDYIYNTVSFLYNAAPCTAWGSIKKVAEWCSKRNL